MRKITLVYKRKKKEVKEEEKYLENNEVGRKGGRRMR